MKRTLKRKQGMQSFLLAMIVLGVTAQNLYAADTNPLSANCSAFLANIKSAMSYGAASSEAALKNISYNTDIS